MEIYDIYDIDRIPTGRTGVRGERPGEGEYRAVVHLCVFGSDGRMLIQRRQNDANSWANLWDVSLGGGVQTGENPRIAVIREAQEELGLELDTRDLRPRFTVSFATGFDDYFIVRQDVELSELKLQPDEVHDVRWASKEDILAMIERGEFIPYRKAMIEMMFAMRETWGAVEI